MTTWIKENAILFSMITGLIACVSTLAVSRYQLSGLVAAMPAVHQHVNDGQRHRDPRDVEEIKELKEQMKSLERRLDRVARYQVWLANGVRQGNTTSIPILVNEPNINEPK